MKLRSFAFTGAMCVLALALAVWGQDKKPVDHGPKGKGKAKAEQSQGQQGMTGMATKQAAEMQKALQQMQGTWSTKGVMEKSDFMPQGATDTGTAVFKPGPGGMSMVQEYHSKGGMGDFHGMGVTWFDPKDQMFHSIWCDSMSPNGCADSGTGKWEGDKIVMNTKFDMGGKSYDMHSTIGPFEGNTFKYSEEVGENGQLKPAMTITYTKKSGAAAEAKKANPKM
jgi:Protein of unknown function (DUF1579)